MKVREVEMWLERFIPPMVDTSFSLSQEGRKLRLEIRASYRRKGAVISEYIYPDSLRNPQELYVLVAEAVGKAVALFAIKYNEASLGKSLPDVRQEMTLPLEEGELSL